MLVESSRVASAAHARVVSTLENIYTFERVHIKYWHVPLMDAHAIEQLLIIANTWPEYEGVKQAVHRESQSCFKVTVHCRR